MTEKISLAEVTELVIKEAEEDLNNPYVFKKPIKNVAVIGAGPSGLPTARHLRDIGMNVRVFDRGSSVGGLWVYSDRPPVKPKMPTSRIKREIDPEALSVSVNDHEREKKTLEMTPEVKGLLLQKCPPSACYRDLYNNTSTNVFHYPDLDFPKGTPSFVPRHVILEYFENYAKKFDLLPMIEFDTSVDLVTKKEDNTWELTLSKYDVYPSGLVKISRWKETFDAVAIASGVHQDPFVPDIKNLAEWTKLYPDKSSHSYQYRRPEDYIDKNILIVGGSISAVDVARSLDGFAKSITMSLDGPFESPIPLFNLIRSTIPKQVVIKSNIASFSDANENVDGTILFEDGTSIDHIDHVIFCTGFRNTLNFMGDLVIEKSDEEAKAHMKIPRPTYYDVPESHVALATKGPLNTYREVFLMSDPTIAFIGQQPALSTLSHFDSQAQSVARVWSGNAILPNKELMNKFNSEFDNGATPLDLFEADRRRREPFIAWLNHHAKALNKELPVLENYWPSYEEDGDNAVSAWLEGSEINLQKTKQYIRDNYL